MARFLQQIGILFGIIVPVISDIMEVHPANCEEVYRYHFGATGLYELHPTDSNRIEAFCQFHETNTGYFFPAKSAIESGMSQEKFEQQFTGKDEILVQVFLKNGDQLKSVIQQLDTSDLNITINSCGDVECPENSTGSLNVQFLNRTLLEHSEQPNGWQDDGGAYNVSSRNHSDITFLTSYSGRPAMSGNQSSELSGVMDDWRTKLNMSVSNETIPDSEKFSFVARFCFGEPPNGSCEASTEWLSAGVALNVTGVAIGLKFEIVDACAGNTQCGSHGFCVDLISGFQCICPEGYSGSFCEYELLQMGCFEETNVSTILDSFTGQVAPNSHSSDVIFKKFKEICTCWAQIGDTNCSSSCKNETMQTICENSTNEITEKVIPIASCSEENCEFCAVPDTGTCLVCQSGFFLVDGACRNLAYRGCFMDVVTDRAMDGIEVTQMPLATLQFCVDFCKGNGFWYAGLQNGTQCFCGNTYAKHRRAVDDTECSEPCDHNEVEICGGHNRLSVYSVTTNKGRYSGFVKTGGHLYISSSTEVASGASSIGSIDCSRVAFQTDVAESFTYVPNQQQCKVYESGEGEFKLQEKGWLN